MIGLKNPNGVACQNEACLGQLFWEDGSDFDVYPTGVTLKFRDNEVCTRVDGANDDIPTTDATQCSDQRRRYICNYKCPEGEAIFSFC